jgi:hypothetical protein
MYQHLHQAVANAHSEDLRRLAEAHRLVADVAPARRGIVGRLRTATRTVTPRSARPAVARAG